MVAPPGPLHILSRYPEAHSILPLLLELGADLEAKDEVCTVISSWLHQGAWIRKARVTTTELPFACLRWVTIAPRSVLLSAQAGNTPIHSFARHNMLQSVSQLLAHGANINSLNHDQDTPLHVAAKLQLEDMMVLLLAFGADESLRVRQRRAFQQPSLVWLVVEWIDWCLAVWSD